MTVAVSGVAPVASARADVRTQWPPRTAVPCRPRVGRSRVALVTRAAKKTKAPVETETAPAEAPSPPAVPMGGLPPPSGYVPPRK